MKKINKTQAFKLFREGKPFTIIPHKLRPGYPFSQGANVLGDAVVRDSFIPPEVNDPVRFAFEKLLREFTHFNCSWEAGYYVAFYTE